MWYQFFLNFCIQLFFNKYFIYFLNYCILQNIITIALLPLYITWGISFSTLSVLGNFIFTPFLILYLAFSIILLIGFCFQKWFLSIVYLQKKLIDVWIYLLINLTNFIPYLILTFVDLPLLSYSICWLLVLLLIVNIKNNTNIYYSFLYSTLSLIFVLIILSSVKAKNNFFIVKDFNKVYIIKLVKNNTIYLHDLDIKKKLYQKIKLNIYYYQKLKKTLV